MDGKERISLGVVNGVIYEVETEFRENVIREYKLLHKNSDLDTGPSPRNTGQIQFLGKLLVIDSVHSGRGRTPNTDFAEIVVRPFFDVSETKYQLIKTTCSDSINRLATNLDTNCEYTILFLSGDTSISEFLNHLPSKHKQISIFPIPLGTGNAWASSLKLKDPGRAFSYFVNGSLKSTQFPLYKAIFSEDYAVKFFIILSMGFHANLLHLCQKPSYQKMGVERFKKASEEILENYDLDNMITLPGIISAHFSYFALINTTHLEPNYIPSPSSDPLESGLHLLGFESGLGKNELLCRVKRGYTNNVGTDIRQRGTIYINLPKTFDIMVENSKSESRKYEICCDGQLINLLDHHKSGPCKFSVKICSNASVMALSPK